MKRLLLLRRFPEPDLALIRARLADRYEIIEWPGDERAAEAAARAELMLGNALPARVLAAADRLELLQVAGSGVDRLDLNAIAERRVIVCNSHSNAPFVAETAVALALALVKQTCRRDRAMRGGELHPGRPGTLFGRRFGFFGFGHVGQQILRLLTGWLPESDPAEPAAFAWSLDPDLWERSLDRDCGPPGQGTIATRKLLPQEAVRFLDRDELLRAADFLFLCLPLTPATRACITTRELRLLGPEAYLVNVARAGLVNYPDLYRALCEGTIAGAGIDVWPESAGPDTAPAWQAFAALDNVVLSPYCAGHAPGAPHLIAALDNLIHYADTGRAGNIVSCVEGY